MMEPKCVYCGKEFLTPIFFMGLHFCDQNCAFEFISDRNAVGLFLKYGKQGITKGLLHSLRRKKLIVYDRDQRLFFLSSKAARILERGG